jgi:DNA-binding response OmpR family regulator
LEDVQPPAPEAFSSHLRGIETALHSLGSDPSAPTALRRLARSLAQAAERAGLADVAARARRVQGAAEVELEPAARDLLALVEVALAPTPDADLEVLLVEDNRTVATTVHAHLKRLARRVHVASTAREAEALLAAHAIDAMVLDLILPDRDGRDLLIQLRDDPATASIPVIVLSGEQGEVARAECLAVGASEFLSKPPDPKALRAAVARQVSARRSRRPSTSGSAAPAPLGPARDAGPVRILLVEDDRVTSTLIRHRLERDGLEVASHANGEDACRWAAESAFDLAILDVKVPGMDGFELLARLRSMPHLVGVPILMLTGLGGEEDVVRGLEIGANDYMVKPFSPAELLARVRRLARRPGAPRHPTGAGAR